MIDDLLLINIRGHTLYLEYEPSHVKLYVSLYGYCVGQSIDKSSHGYPKSDIPWHKTLHGAFVGQNMVAKRQLYA